MAMQPISWLREGNVHLLWAPAYACPQQNVVAYATDDKQEFSYNSFNPGRDFGPLDLCATVTYCRWVDALIQTHTQNALVHITTERPECWSNTITLCGAYLVLAKGFSAAAAYQPFAHVQLPHFVDCRGDASSVFEDLEPDFQLSVLDVLQGLQHVRDLGWLDYRTYPVEVHASMLQPEHGDMTWLLQGKAIAMASPWVLPVDGEKLPVCTPEALVPYFMQNKVAIIIQCNHPQAEEKGDRQQLLSYNPKLFECAGIRHVWLPFEDGGCPSVDIIQRFLSTCEANGCAFAVHCRSGLGRTATLIGAFAIRHFGFSARSFIGWSRVARPGTVHGSQQQYLVNLEPYLRMGAPKALSALSPSEQLRLLPRRELRFWALDLGIERQQTEGKPEDEIIPMILQARGHVVAEHASQAFRPPDPATVHRSSTGPSVAAVTLPVPVAPGPELLDPSPRAPDSELPGEENAWAELQKYLRMLCKEESNGWLEVAQLVEKLRQLPSGAGPPPDTSPAAQLSSADQAELARAAEVSKHKDEELQRVLQQFHAVQSDCSQLRLDIAKGQGDAEAEASAMLMKAQLVGQLGEAQAHARRLREQRDAEQQALQSAKQRLNEPWESAKHSLDRLRLRLQAT